MTNQRDAVYEAEELAEWECGDPPMDLPAAQALAEQVLEWAKVEFGIRPDLSVRVEEYVTEGTAEEISRAWEDDGNAGRVVGPMWLDGSPTSVIEILTSIVSNGGPRIGITDHLLLHELAHVVVGEWTMWERDPATGAWTVGDVVGPDRHGALFARRQLDIIEHFHPQCAGPLAWSYEEHGVEVAERDTDPASFWNIPRPTQAEIEAAIGVRPTPTRRDQR